MTNPPAEPTSARRRGVWRRFGRGPVVAAAAIAALIAIGATGNVGQTYALWSDTSITQPQVATAGLVKTTAALSTSPDTVYTASSLTKVRALTFSNSGTVTSTYSSSVSVATGTTSIPASSIAVDAFRVGSVAECTATQTGSAATGAWATSFAGISGSLTAGASAIYCLRTTLKSTTGLTTNHTLNALITTTLKSGSWTSTANTTLAQSVGDVVAPTTPTGVIGTAVTDSSISIAWNASTDNVAVTGYDVFQNGALIGSTTAANRTFTHTGLSSATAQSYTVKAKDAAGNSSAASTALGVTSFNSAPRYQIKNTNSGKCLNVRRENTQTLQQWSCGALGTDNESWKFTGPNSSGLYTVSPLSQPGNSWDVSGASTADEASVILWSTTGSANQLWRIVPLPNGTFQFVASHSGKCLDVRGASTLDGAILQQYWCSPTNTAQTFSLTQIVTDTTAPSVPTGLTASGTTSTSTVLSWTASYDANGVTGYLIYRNGASTPIATVTGTSYTDNSLSPSTSYSYTVRARDASGNISAASTSRSVTTLARPITPVPTMGCSSSGWYLTYTWTNPAPGDPPDARYVLYVNSSTSVASDVDSWQSIIGLSPAAVHAASSPGVSVPVTLKKRLLSGQETTIAMGLVKATFDEWGSPQLQCG